METKSDNSIPDLRKQREKLKETITEMAIKEKQIELLESEKIKEGKLIERRVMVGSKKKVLEMYAKDYSKYTRFLGQIEFFERHWDNWVKAKKDNPELSWKEEMELIAQINRQYTFCIEILQIEVSRDVLGFRNEFNVWQKKVDKRLSKLEKK